MYNGLRLLRSLSDHDTPPQMNMLQGLSAITQVGMWTVGQVSNPQALEHYLLLFLCKTFHGLFSPVECHAIVY